MHRPTHVETKRQRSRRSHLLRSLHRGSCAIRDSSSDTSTKIRSDHFIIPVARMRVYFARSRSLTEVASFAVNARSEKVHWSIYVPTEGPVTHEAVHLPGAKDRQRSPRYRVRQRWSTGQITIGYPAGSCYARARAFRTPSIGSGRRLRFYSTIVISKASDSMIAKHDVRADYRLTLSVDFGSSSLEIAVYEVDPAGEKILVEAV